MRQSAGIHGRIIMKKPTQVIGYIQPDWIEKQIKLEDNIMFARSTHYVPKAEVLKSKFSITKPIKQAFASSFDFISSLPKL